MSSAAYSVWIPVDSTKRRDVPPDKFRSRGTLSDSYRITASLICLSNVHVGTGEKDLVHQGRQFKPLLLNYRAGDGRVAIPGSTLKGVSSTNYLVLTGNSLAASELFGNSLNPAISKVFFLDAKPGEDVRPVIIPVDRSWRPRIVRSNRVKVYVGRAPPTQEYGLAECIPGGSRLTTFITASGVSQIELGGLIYSLGAKPESEEAGILKLGYGKAKCLGQLIVDLQSLTIERFDALNLSWRRVDPSKMTKEFHDAYRGRIERYWRYLFGPVRGC